MQMAFKILTFVVSMLSITWIYNNIVNAAA